MPEINEIRGVGPVLGTTFAGCGYDSVKKVAAATVAELTAVPGIGQARAKLLIGSAQTLLGQAPSPAASNGNAGADSGFALAGLQAKKSKKGGKNKTGKKSKKLKKAKKKEKSKKSKKKKSKNGRKK